MVGVLGYVAMQHYSVRCCAPWWRSPLRRRTEAIFPLSPDVKLVEMSDMQHTHFMLLHACACTNCALFKPNGVSWKILA